MGTGRVTNAWRARKQGVAGSLRGKATVRWSGATRALGGQERAKRALLTALWLRRQCG